MRNDEQGAQKRDPQRARSNQTLARALWLVADQTSASIDIAAKPDDVMAVIADFEHYPDWVDSMKSAEVLTSVAGSARRSAWCSTTRW